MADIFASAATFPTNSNGKTALSDHIQILPPVQIPNETQAEGSPPAKWPKRSLYPSGRSTDCPICGKTLASIFGCRDHMKLQHPEREMPEWLKPHTQTSELSSAQDSVKCPFCAKVLISARGCRAHITRMHAGKEVPVYLKCRKYTFKAAKEKSEGSHDVQSKGTGSYDSRDSVDEDTLPFPTATRDGKPLPVPLPEYPPDLY